MPSAPRLAFLSEHDVRRAAAWCDSQEALDLITLDLAIKDHGEWPRQVELLRLFDALTGKRLTYLIHGPAAPGRVLAIFAVLGSRVRLTGTRAISRPWQSPSDFAAYARAEEALAYRALMQVESNPAPSRIPVSGYWTSAQNDAAGQRGRSPRGVIADEFPFYACRALGPRSARNGANRRISPRIRREPRSRATARIPCTQPGSNGSPTINQSALQAGGRRFEPVTAHALVISPITAYSRTSFVVSQAGLVRLNYPGSYLKQGLVCHEDDHMTMLNHCLAQMRLRGLG